MLNRRHLRIKILQALYAYAQSDNNSYSAGEKELFHSIEKMYDLYIAYLLVLPELRDFALNKIEDRKKKLQPTEDELNPNLNFVNNKILIQLSENLMLHQKSESIKIDWIGDVSQDLVKKLYKNIEDSVLYINYIEETDPSYEDQKAFILKLFRKEICNSRVLLNHFEEERIHWQDDFDHVFSMALKTLKQFKASSDDLKEIMTLYKDDEEEFSSILFRKSISNYDEHTHLIGKFTKNWDADRLAKMDILIMNLAITEAKEFPSIPLNVTMNEYLEISKFYSTPKSSNFINGVLDKVFKKLKADGDIKKVGRGLV